MRQMKAALQDAQINLQFCQQELASTKEQLSALLNSRSWKLTDPLRKLAAQIRKWQS